jgi:hypothetical protein
MIEVSKEEVQLKKTELDKYKITTEGRSIVEDGIGFNSYRLDLPSIVRSNFGTR